VRGGKLDATGRLFVVDSIAFSEGIRKFPQIQATLTVSAYAYGSSGGATAPAPAPATPPASPPPPAAPPAAPPASPDTPPTASAAPATP
jgi:hypothetical protein